MEKMFLFYYDTFCSTDKTKPYERNWQVWPKTIHDVDWRKVKK